MLATTLQQFQNTPFVLLMLIGLGFAVSSFAVNWASTICLADSISYMRCAMSVMGLAFLNLLLLQLLGGMGLSIYSPGTVAAVVIVSTLMLTVMIPAEPVNAFLILALSTAVTVGAGLVVIMVCEYFAVPGF